MKKNILLFVTFFGCTAALHAVSEESSGSYLSSTYEEIIKVSAQKKSAQPSFYTSYASLPSAMADQNFVPATAERDSAGQPKKAVQIIGLKKVMLANKAQYADGDKNTFIKKNAVLELLSRPRKNNSIEILNGGSLYANHRRLKDVYLDGYDSCDEKKK